MKLKINKFKIDVESMHCPKCQHTSGHTLNGPYWTCLDCGHQLGKKISWYNKLIKKLFV